MAIKIRRRKSRSRRSKNLFRRKIRRTRRTRSAVVAPKRRRRRSVRKVRSRRARTVIKTRTRTRTVVKTRRVKARSVRRRSSRKRSSGFSSSPLSFAKGIFSKDNLLRAGGFVGGGILTQLVLNRYRNSLPYANHQYGRFAYAIGIPAVGAFLAAKFRQPRLAEGMIASGLAIGISELIARALPAAPGAVAGAKEYFIPEYAEPQYLPAPSVAPLAGAYDTEPAFSNEGW